jgi:uncharacterized protein YggE
MKKLVFYLLVVIVTFLLSCPNLFAEENTVTVTGKAKIKHKPDVAFVTLYIKADGILMSDAVKKADQKVEDVKEAIQDKFKNIKSFEVYDVSIGEAQREYFVPDRKEETSHPEIVRRIRIMIDPNPAQSYELIDIAIRAGALMEIPSRTRYSEDVRSNVVYGLLKSIDIEKKVSEAALADAKQKAQKLAALAGKKIGDVINIGCSGSCSYDFPIRIMGLEPDFPTEYIGMNSEEISISQSISVTYELKKE